MAKPVTRAAGSWSFVTETDLALPVAERTTFRLRPMNGAERDAAQDDLARPIVDLDGSRRTVSRTRQTARMLCVSHIETVENFPPGAPEPWPEEHAARVAYLDRMDDDVVLAVGNEIFLRSMIGPAEKNSSPPGPTSN